MSLKPCADGTTGHILDVMCSRNRDFILVPEREDCRYAVPNVSEYYGIRDIRPLINLFDLGVTVYYVFALSKPVAGIARTKVMSPRCVL